jgi:hypothetical protein
MKARSPESDACIGCGLVVIVSSTIGLTAAIVLLRRNANAVPAGSGVATRREPKAYVALGLALAAWTPLLPILGAVLALVAARLARRDITASGGTLTGASLVTAAIVLSIVHLVVILAAVLWSAWCVYPIDSAWYSRSEKTCSAGYQLDRRLPAHSVGGPDANATRPRRTRLALSSRAICPVEDGDHADAQSRTAAQSGRDLKRAAGVNKRRPEYEDAEEIGEPGQYYPSGGRARLLYRLARRT